MVVYYLSQPRTWSPLVDQQLGKGIKTVFLAQFYFAILHVSAVLPEYHPSW